MLNVINLRSRSLDVDRMEVTWEVDGYDDPRDYTMQVFRSEALMGPFEPVTTTFEDRYIFVDARIPQGDKYRQLWYRLVLIKKSDEATATFGPVTQEAEPDLVAQYIRRAEQTLFTQATGRMCWLFKARTFGPRCTSCWDRVLGKSRRSNCLSCFDTGFLRGYHDPMEVWVQIDPAAKARQNVSQQSSQQVGTRARMTSYPNIAPDDVLVEAENKRWIVLTVEQSERLRAPIKQELTLKEIELTDIEYKLPINLDRALRDIQPSPVRMFSNPTGLHNAMETRVPDVFANYETYPKDPNR